MVRVPTGLLNVALVLLLLPGAYHRIVEKGQDSNHFHRFVTAIAACVLLPLSLTLALNAYLAGEKVGGRSVGFALAPCVLLIALILWYGLEVVARKLKGKSLMSHPEGSEEEETKLSHKIRHVLTEARVVLPGAQALLGFQFRHRASGGVRKAALRIEERTPGEPAPDSVGHHPPDGLGGLPPPGGGR